MGIVLFISHSHRDKRLAKALVDLLRDGLDVKTRDIRCTSFAPSGLGAGRKIDKSLRKDLAHCSCFIPLITENAMRSEYVHFEIGAAWGLQAEILPAVFTKRINQKTPAVLSGFVYTNLTKRNDVVKLASAVSKKIWRARDQVDAVQILGAAKDFLHAVHDL
jgi:hypothetical protein